MLNPAFKKTMQSFSIFGTQGWSVGMRVVEGDTIVQSRGQLFSDLQSNEPCFQEMLVPMLWLSNQ